MKNTCLKVAKCITSMVMMLNILSVSSACWWHLHQPKVPEQLKALKHVNK